LERLPGTTTLPGSNSKRELNKRLEIMNKERGDFMNDLRSELAREWAKEHHIQLSLFNREYQIDLKVTSKQRRLNKGSSEKSKEICQGI